MRRPGRRIGLGQERHRAQHPAADSQIRPGTIVDGSILFKGRDLLKLSWDEIRAIRGKEISMIFQEPMTSLNPVFTIGMQMTEAVLAHERVSKKEAFERSVEMLELVGIPDPASRMNDYPQQFSGGMRQRVMIAMALACNPSLLIADEPTTALDVTIQAQILELMLRIKDQRKDAAILLITHNLARGGGDLPSRDRHVRRQDSGSCAGEGAVPQSAASLHARPAGLVPTVDGDRRERLPAIPGNVPSILDLPVGCKFETRCSERLERCAPIEPQLVETSPGHWVRCHLVNP